MNTAFSKPQQQSSGRWRAVRLAEVAEIIAGQSPPGSTYRRTPEGLPFFQGKTDFGPRHPVPRVWCTEPNKIAEPGDILISVRAPVGPTNVADVKCCIGRGIAAIRPGKHLDRDFLLHILKVQEPALVALGSGSTFSAITRRELDDITLPLPPLSEQKRIAARLNEQLAIVGRAVTASSSAIDAADAVLQQVLGEMYTERVLHAAPEVPLGELLELRKEVVHPHDNPHGAMRFVGLEHIESGTGRQIGFMPVLMEELTGRKPRFYKGDIVYGYLRPYLNKVWLADSDGLCSVDQYVYRINTKRVRPQFVAWFMRSPLFLRRAPISTSPGQLPRIRTDEVAQVRLAVPSLREQDVALARLERQITMTHDLRNALFETLTSLSNMSNALLREAFAGAQ